MKQKVQAPSHWERQKPKPQAEYFGAREGPDGVHGRNFFAGDQVLRRLLIRHSPQLLHQLEDRLSNFGSWIGSTVDNQAEYTNTMAPPRLESHDRHGELINRVVHNPRYVQCQRELYRRGFFSLNYASRPVPHLFSFSLGYLLSQADPSLHVSAALSGTVALVLAHHAPEDVRRKWLPRMLRSDGSALTGSTWTTERDNASDAAKNTIRARKLGNEVKVNGLKWFAGSPDCDLALVTARLDGEPSAQEGQGLYLLPRRLDNGKLNQFRIRRLKNTIGTRGLAAGEVELNDCTAVEISPPPHGLSVVQSASNYSRIHAAMAGVASQRRTLMESLNITSLQRGRERTLTNQPMIQDILLDLRAEYEADMGLAFLAATAFDRALQHPLHIPWLRLLTCMATYRSNVNAVNATTAGMELFGCNGYVEEFIISRLHRDALMVKVWGGPVTQLATETVELLSAHSDLRERFGRDVRKIIDKAPIKASRLSGGLRKALADYEEITRYLMRFPDSKARLGFHLLELMANIFAAALQLQQAGEDIEQGDARTAIMLDNFLRRHFPDSQGRLRIRNSEQLKYFEYLITGTPISSDGDWENGLRKSL